MTEQLQLRRGAATQVAAFTGAQGELVVDTTNNRLVVQDGATAGGFPAAKLNETQFQTAEIGVGTAPDPNNPLSVYGASALFNGVGFNLAVNKAATANTASIIFEDGFSGRAQVGLCGDDNFHFKVSANGSTWLDAIDVNASTGQVSFNCGIAAGGAPGFRNRIVNGGMAIDQRNAGAAQIFTAGAALAYCIDRFYGYCAGANVTGQRVAGSAPDQFLYQFTGAASVTAIGFGQRIETANSFDLAGQTATLSVELANSLLTTVNWAAYYATTADAFGTLASPTKTLITSGSFTVSSTLTKYSAQIAVPSAATTGIEIVLFVGAQTSGTWKIGEVQLEVGQVATPFERRPIGLELALCLRYFFGLTSSLSPYTKFGAAFCNTTTTAIGNFPFPSLMRAAPTLSFSAASTFGLTSGMALSTLNVDVATTNAMSLTLGGTGGTAGSGGLLQSGNTTSAYVYGSAEL
jgi:hypothetical protein